MHKQNTGTWRWEKQRLRETELCANKACQPCQGHLSQLFSFSTLNLFRCHCFFSFFLNSEGTSFSANFALPIKRIWGHLFGLWQRQITVSQCPTFKELSRNPNLSTKLSLRSSSIFKLSCPEKLEEQEQSEMPTSSKDHCKRSTTCKPRWQAQSASM